MGEISKKYNFHHFCEMTITQEEQAELPSLKFFKFSKNFFFQMSWKEFVEFVIHCAQMLVMQILNWKNEIEKEKKEISEVLE